MLIGGRWAAALGLVIACIALGVHAAATEAPKPLPRVGYLGGSSIADRLPLLRRALAEIGYVEGRTVTIEARFSDGRDDELGALAQQLVEHRVDLIVADSVAPALAARAATGTIPIVFLSVSDPIARGLVTSIAHPGANVTGIAGAFSAPELNSKRLEQLRDAVPGLVRVAVLRYKSPSLPELPRSSWDVLQDAARALGLKLQLHHVQNVTELERAFPAMTRERAQAIFVVASPFFRTHRARLVALVAESRRPASYSERAFVEAGGLMSYGEKSEESFRRAAMYVDKILKGAKPADLPVEQWTKLELVINLKASAALGLTLPPSILLQADDVIR